MHPTGRAQENAHYLHAPTYTLTQIHTNLHTHSIYTDSRGIFFYRHLRLAIRLSTWQTTPAECVTIWRLVCFCQSQARAVAHFALSGRSKSTWRGVGRRRRSKSGWMIFQNRHTRFGHELGAHRWAVLAGEKAGLGFPVDPVRAIAASSGERRAKTVYAQCTLARIIRVVWHFLRPVLGKGRAM